MSITPLSSPEPLESRITPSGFKLGPSVLDLNGRDGFNFSSDEPGAFVGYSVSEAGDFNGDGFPDFIVGGSRVSGGAAQSGAAYVIFGNSGGFPADLNVTNVNGTNGFRITTSVAQALFGGSVSGGGDFNGDGFDDVVIGSVHNGFGEGGVYVVFGSSGPFPASLDVATLDGTNGFAFTGLLLGQEAIVANAGDFNGDGLDDMVVSTSFGDTAYVIFGTSSGLGATLAAGDLNGSNGFTITTPDLDFTHLASAGDVNGDGFDDIIFGTTQLASYTPQLSSAYVVFGNSDSLSLGFDLSSLDGNNGFRITGATIGDFFGYNVSTAGDVNGDGFDDVIIGASGLASGGPYGTKNGSAYVVFGKESGFAANLSVTSLNGTNGFRLTGFGAFNGNDIAVDGAGDFNGDGINDLVIGSSPAFVGPGDDFAQLGGIHVIYGKTSGFPAEIDVQNLDKSAGLRVQGITIARSVTSVGDLNGDGFDDVLIGMPFVDGGLASVIFGFDSRVSVSKSGKTISLTDADGDLVTIKISKGKLVPQNVVLGPNGELLSIDLGGAAEFRGANITINAKLRPGGNGVVDLGRLDARTIDLGKVKVTGTLGSLMAGDDESTKPAVKALTVGSLGTDEVLVDPLVSEIRGALKKLTVGGDIRGAAVDVRGDLGKVTIGGNLVGDLNAGAALLASINDGGRLGPRVGGGIPFGAVEAGSIGSFKVAGNMTGGSVTAQGDIGSVSVRDLTSGGIAAAGQIRVTKISGSLNGADPTQPSVIAALARLGSTKPADAVAIDKLTVNGDVTNGQILLGYQRERDEVIEYLPKNPDASAGKVVIKGNWSASNLVAGVFDETGDGFGRNDQRIGGDTTTGIAARIASIVIKGTATGSAVEGEHYAITAEFVGKLSIGGEKFTLSKTEKDNVELGENFRLVEL
jgi:hypothetical protein